MLIGRAGGLDAVAGEHSADGRDMALGNPKAFGVFVNDIEVVVGIEAAEEDNGVMGVAVVHAGAPVDGAGVIELIDDMDVMTEGAEELAGGNVPASMVPRVFLPAGAAGEYALVFGVREFVVVDASGNDEG